ncbi:MAG TPA: LuxR family transcriptional regulator [Albitalea sp.]|nr:LuxR family transcriptional regulator [Albitalea sp.]
MTTCKELFDEALRFTRQLGFDTFNAVAVIDRLGSESEFVGVDNAPPAYRQLIEDRDGGRRDPVMQRCKRSHVPVVWNQGTYIDAGCADKWEIQASHGYRTGIAFALHLPQGRHFCLGVDRAERLPRHADEMTRMVAEVQLFAAHAVDAALRILLPRVADAQTESPSARELECLRWTMEGKTAWEVGRILGISESTVVRHVNNAARKLNCVNKHQAVVKALRAGLIA